MDILWIFYSVIYFNEEVTRHDNYIFFSRTQCINKLEIFRVVIMTIESNELHFHHTFEYQRKQITYGYKF